MTEMLPFGQIDHCNFDTGYSTPGQGRGVQALGTTAITHRHRKLQNSKESMKGLDVLNLIYTFISNLKLTSLPIHEGFRIHFAESSSIGMSKQLHYL